MMEAHPFHRLLQARRSVRAFLPDPVPHDLLVQIFEAAKAAPSNCNVQPWIVHIVSGKALAELGTRLHAAAAAGEAITPDFPLTGAYPDAYRTRQIEAAKAYFAVAGVERHDTAARTELALRNFRFFGAPHAALIFMPDWAGWREAADVGMYAQSLMLTMAAHGVASCAQGSVSHYADSVHQMLDVPHSQKLLFGVAFGYADPSNAVADRQGAA